MKDPIPHRLPSGKWRVQIQRSGWPKIDRADFPTQEAAQAEIDKLKVRFGPLLGAAQTLAGAWDLYITSDTYENHADTTQATERRCAAHWLPLLGHITLASAEAQPQLFVSYRRDRLKKSYKPGKNTPERRYGANQIRLELASLSSLFNFSREEGWMQRNPILGVKRPYKKAENRRVPPTERGRILLALVNKTLSDDDREKARFFTLLHELGCRPGELAGLLKTDLDLSDQLVIFPETKNGDDRGVPLTTWQVSQFADQLVHSPEGAPYVFPTLGRDGEWKIYNYSGAWKKLKKLGVVDQEDGTRPHDRRHEHCSDAIEKGISSDEIRLVTGHQSTQAFDRYNHARATAHAARARIAGRVRENAAGSIAAMISALETADASQERDEALARFRAILKHQASAPA